MGKQVRTPPGRPADGVVKCEYESFVRGEGYRELGLRPLIVSRVKYEGGPCYDHSVFPQRGVMESYDGL